ncbi:PAS domain S-box protein [Aeromicrobium yanjiei]|uniref:histidine kinase n=2 Tax=Aeromicrobium yanjiei TaxID=2662028 RepID=A0A5Q2MKR2_9ACTN|nr:PAS domain S-box protein [Aeromicrobium yanjiei]
MSASWGETMVCGHRARRSTQHSCGAPCRSRSAKDPRRGNWGSLSQRPGTMKSVLSRCDPLVRPPAAKWPRRDPRLGYAAAMRASALRPREPQRTAISFGASVFRTQALLAGAFGVVVCVTLALSERRFDDSPGFFAGLTIVLWATIAAAIVPWLRLPVHAQIALPLLDIFAIVLLRNASPESGFGILLIFPAIWLAMAFGRLGSVLGPLFAGVLLWGGVAQAQLGVGPAAGTSAGSAVAAASLTVTLAFVSVITHLTAERVESQRVLLRRQTAMLEKALQRARRQEAILREAFDAVEFAVISLDLDGTTLTTNRATRALLSHLGLPDDTPWERYPLYRADRVTPVPAQEMPHLRVMRGETVDSETYVIGHRTGTRFTIHVTARMLRDESGEVDRVVLVLRDVSAEVRAIADRDDLVTSMSHELRTPLSSVLGYVDLALEVDGLPDEARSMLDIALVNTQRLNSLVNDLLSARSRSPENAITVSLQDCDITAIVVESIDAQRIIASERLIPVNLVTDGGTVRAPADAFRLRQVVDNLLSNAIKYNDIGGRVTVAVHDVVRDDGSEAVEIRVSDTGRGMTLDEQKGLFERFYRAESVRGSTTHGTGLGLAISREIVVMHGGAIEVASEPDRGTEVVVTLPNRPAAHPSAVRTKEA